MEIIIALAVVGLLVLFFVAQYNRLIRLNISVDESFAQIEVQLKRRSDLIPKLVETVKGAADFEKSTLEAVTSARASASQVKIDPTNITPEQLAQFNQAQSGVSSSLS